MDNPRFGFGIVLMSALLAQRRKTPHDPHAIMSHDEPPRVAPASRDWAMDNPDSASYEFYKIMERLAAGEQP